MASSGSRCKPSTVVRGLPRKPRGSGRRRWTKASWRWISSLENTPWAWWSTGPWRCRFCQGCYQVATRPCSMSCDQGWCCWPSITSLWSWALADTRWRATCPCGLCPCSSRLRQKSCSTCEYLLRGKEAGAQPSTTFRSASVALWTSCHPTPSRKRRATLGLPSKMRPTPWRRRPRHLLLRCAWTSSRSTQSAPRCPGSAT
mmetsp:Transcript_31591/g.75361  ORF Transcript_31591/g.75361 Transcript_31591/m.75361 type:complete len:201 (-) Transcript_31591:1092-1694(-)